MVPWFFFRTFDEACKSRTMSLSADCQARGVTDQSQWGGRTEVGTLDSVSVLSIAELQAPVQRSKRRGNDLEWYIAVRTCSMVAPWPNSWRRKISDTTSLVILAFCLDGYAHLSKPPL